MANGDFTKGFDQKLGKGQLSLIDKIPWGDPDIGSGIVHYIDTVYTSRHSRRWARVTNYVENFLFGLGHHYITNVLLNRLSKDSSDNLFLTEDSVRQIPQPVNDLLGRYIETNIALLTENRPVPRVTSTSDNITDTKAAELSELVINYLWEELGQGEKHRDIARLLMYTGVAWNEICYDPLIPRYMPVPETVQEPTTPLSSGIEVPVPRNVPVVDEKTGELKYRESIEYGDITSTIVSPFEMHVPTVHGWKNEELGWVMREQYLPIETLLDKYKNPEVKKLVTKENGYFVDNLDSATSVNLNDLPLWWWEKFTDMVEGPMSSLFAATPEVWEGYTVLRILDRKPSPTWPRGRTIITAGDQVIYDSPKKVGARAFDPRWPHRWHPYVRYRWEAILGSIYGRALVGKLLPCVKRINSIDALQILWRRTAPISCWLFPRGTSPVEDFISGQPGSIIEYDPRRSMNQAPQPVYPPPFPESALKERDIMLEQMEAIAGTEQILKGERPVGVNCWVENSHLTDSNGLPIPVSEIQVGDKHLSLTGEGSIGLVHKQQYHGKVISLRSWGNLKVTTTKDHKFPVIPKEAFLRKPSGHLKQNKKTGKCITPTADSIVKKTANNIEKGDCFLAGFSRPRDHDNKLSLLNHGSAILSNQKKNVQFLPVNVKLDSELLWLFGLYLADGHATKSQTIITLHSKEQDIANRAKQAFENYFDLDHVTIIPVKDKNAIRVCTFSSALARVFKSLLGNGSRTKKIHEDIFRSNISLLPLVAGWLDGDGSLDGNTIKGSTTSKYLASQFRAILLDEHIYSPIRVEKKHKYSLVISGFDAKKVANYTNRYNNITYKAVSKGRKGFWVGNYYASYIWKKEENDYSGYVYNVTMDERKGCDNSVNSFGLFSYQSATMLEALRKQALASRSAILTSWDESLQEVGTALLQETIKHIKDDKRYKDRLSLLAREKISKLQIDEFSGTNLSDNVQVRIDTASEALVSREARQQRALELIQYGPALAAIEPSLRAKLVAELGYKDATVPQGADISRARNLIHYIKTKKFELAIPMPEDDPYVIHEMLVNETKEATFMDLENEVQRAFFMLVEQYKEMIEQIEAARLQFQQQVALMQGGGPGGPTQ